MISRAQITDTGLARRLGQEVEVIKIKRGKMTARAKGKLVFFPDSFAVGGAPLNISIEKGNYIRLRTGKGKQKAESYTTYVYRPSFTAF